MDQQQTSSVVASVRGRCAHGASGDGASAAASALLGLDEICQLQQLVGHTGCAGTRVLWSHFAARVDNEILEKGPTGSELDGRSKILSGGVTRTGAKSYGASILVLDLVKDLWAYMKVRKKFWLLPIFVSLLLLGVLIVLAQGSAVAPFIYTLF